MDCPVCKEENLYRESADVGVGILYGPYGCPCGWSEADEYNLLSGSAGIQDNGAYIDQYGAYYPPENITAIIQRRKQNEN